VYLVFVNYIVPEEEVTPVRAQHFEFIDRHFAANEFVLGGRRSPGDGGFILVRDLGREKVEQIIAEDPYLAAGVAVHELIDLHPARVQPAIADFLGLERLVGQR